MAEEECFAGTSKHYSWNYRTKALILMSAVTGLTNISESVLRLVFFAMWLTNSLVRFARLFKQIPLLFERSILLVFPFRHVPYSVVGTT
jgi:hypothetical protein